MKIAILMLLLGSLVACGGRNSSPAVALHLSIGQVFANPKLLGKPIVLTGRVTSDFGVGPVGWFELTDNTGKISVVCIKALPREHDYIEAFGIPHQALVVGGTRKIIFKANNWKSIPPPKPTS